MKKILTAHKGSAISLGMVFVLVFMAGELLLETTSLRLAVRWSVVVSLLNFPVLLWIYRRGLKNEMTEAFQTIGLSMVWKFVMLFGTTFILWKISDINVLFYFILLFFSLFSLSFIAIYMSISNADERSNRDDV